MYGQLQDKRYKGIDDMIFYKDRIYLVPESKLEVKIMDTPHDAPSARHLGFFKT